MRYIRVVLTACLIAVGTIALAGCSGGGPSKQSPPVGFMDLAGVQSEYDKTIRHFPYQLPDKVTFPVKVQQPKEPTTYQKGAGLDQAYQFWECAWQDQALKNQGTDAVAVARALDSLEGGLTSTYRTQYVVDTDGIWKKVLSQSKLGDLSTLGEFYNSDCIWYRAETGQ